MTDTPSPRVILDNGCAYLEDDLTACENAIGPREVFCWMHDPALIMQGVRPLYRTVKYQLSPTQWAVFLTADGKDIYSCRFYSDAEAASKLQELTSKYIG